MSSIHKTTLHYNLDVKFFQKFLDPYMKYTSGLFDAKHQDLDAAIVNMLDRIIAVATLPRNARVLDIGSGWGALRRRLFEIRPDVEYFGVSPSLVQNEYIAGFGYPKTHLSTETFETVVYAAQTFDAIFLIGSYCHLSDKNSSLKKMTNMLRKSGKIIIEDTFFINEELLAKHRVHPATKFVQQEIFGFAEIGAFGPQMELFSQHGLVPEYLLEHTSSYKSTIAEWRKRIGNDGVMEEKFQKYFDIFQKGWDRTINNHLISLRQHTQEKAN